MSVLVELKRTKDLFFLAHKLVDLCPHKEVFHLTQISLDFFFHSINLNILIHNFLNKIAWFAVGAYYFLVKKQELARRFLRYVSFLCGYTRRYSI